MRREYQSEADLQNEERIIGEYTSYLTSRYSQKFHWNKTSRFEEYDFYLYDELGNVAAFVEVKRRGVSLKRLGSLKISFSKYQAINRLGKLFTNFPCEALILVEDNDTIYAFQPSRHQYLSPMHWGRKDRGDKFDMEPCVEIPWKMLTDIRKLNARLHTNR